MKRFLITVVIIILTQLSFAQGFYIGQTEEQVRTNIKKSHQPNAVITRGEYKEGYYLQWKIAAGIQVVYFKNDIVDMSGLKVANDEDLKAAVEMFNEKFVKVTDKEWRVYQNGNTYKIELLYLENVKSYCFFFTLSS